MKKIVSTIGALALTATAAQAGGIDRSGQSMGALFEKGRYLEFSVARVNPKLVGTDVALFGGRTTGEVAGSFTQLGFAYKYDINEKLSFALIVDQPFGANILYGATSVALGGTQATANTTAVTGLLRYKLGNGFSVHGGPRYQRASGNIDLRGAAYGGLNGYSVDLAQDSALGYSVGVAYEKPEIALRVALTYNSAITHNFSTTETFRGVQVAPTGITKVRTPESVNLDFQSGVAKDTLVFGSIRWAHWTQFKIDPAFFTPRAGGGLVSLENSVTYTLGVGRKFNDTWSGAFSMTYEKEKNPLVSPLAPSTGRLGAAIAAVYTRDNLKITTGISYSKLGDASAETGTPDTARANFNNNSALGVGIKFGYSF